MSVTSFIYKRARFWATSSSLTIMYTSHGPTEFSCKMTSWTSRVSNKSRLVISSSISRIFLRKQGMEAITSTILRTQFAFKGSRSIMTDNIRIPQKATSSMTTFQGMSCSAASSSFFCSKDMPISDIRCWGISLTKSTQSNKACTKGKCPSLDCATNAFRFLGMRSSRIKASNSSPKLSVSMSFSEMRWRGNLPSSSAIDA
mmetsp:Transcript_1620/g.3377  ORF Transcript_1620/g.3377 Transcript_1620/m.3377 type:complete len:201 (+) Transcript_1620:2463-3065(+)